MDIHIQVEEVLKPEEDHGFAIVFVLYSQPMCSCHEKMKLADYPIPGSQNI